MKSALELFVELQRKDKNSISCIRGDLEKLHRHEVSLMRSSEVVGHEVHSRYVNTLETFLDFVCVLEGYNRHEQSTTFNFGDLSELNPKLPDLVKDLTEESTEEEPSKRWVTA